MKKLKYLLFLIPLFFIPFFLPKEVKAEVTTGWVYIQPKSNIATRIGFDTTGKLKLLLATGSLGKSSGQKFLITKLSDETYRINTGSGGGFKVLTNNLDQEAWNKSSAQKFNIIENSDSTVQIVNGNKALTYSNKTIGTKLTMSAKTTNDNQKFIIKPFSEKYTVTFKNGIIEENILKNTNNPNANTLSKTWYTGGWGVGAAGDGKGEITTLKDSPNKGITTGFKLVGNTTGNKDWMQANIPFKNGEKYEISGYVRVPSNGASKMQIRFYDYAANKSLFTQKKDISGNKWQYFSYQTVFNGTEDKTAFQAGLTGAGDIEYCGLSLKRIHDDTLKRCSVSKNASITAPSSPIREGYTFNGWDKTFTNIISNTTITAKWTPKSYKLLFNGNGATSGSMTTLTNKSYNSEVSLPENNFVKTNYTFSSWNTKVDGTGISFKNKTIYTIPATNSTLYAQWKLNTYKVTFIDMDGTVLKEEKIEHGSSANAPSNPKKANLTFLSWDKDYSNITENTTVTALYSTTPESFGAKGDGKTDDTSAIQKAINSGANKIIFSNSYYMNGRVTIRRNDLILNGGGTISFPIGENVQKSLFDVSQAKGVIFNDLHFISTDTETVKRHASDNRAYCIYFHTNKSIDAPGTYNFDSYVTNCSFINTGRTPVKIASSGASDNGLSVTDQSIPRAGFIVVRNNEFVNNKGVAISTAGATNLKIDSNYFKDSSIEHITLDWSTRNSTVTKNTFEGITGGCGVIGVDTAYDCTISGNNFKNCLYAPHVRINDNTGKSKNIQVQKNAVVTSQFENTYTKI